MKISQLSKETGASARSIRYYEKKKLLSARRLDNDYREFDEADVKRIKTIQIYLELGMSTKEILEILKCHDNYDAYDSDKFCEEMLGAYEEKHAEIVHQIQIMTTVQLKLQQRRNDEEHGDRHSRAIQQHFVNGKGLGKGLVQVVDRAFSLIVRQMSAIG